MRKFRVTFESWTTGDRRVVDMDVPDDWTPGDMARELHHFSNEMKLQVSIDVDEIKSPLTTAEEDATEEAK